MAASKKLAAINILIFNQLQIISTQQLASEQDHQLLRDRSNGC